MSPFRLRMRLTRLRRHLALLFARRRMAGSKRRARLRRRCQPLPQRIVGNMAPSTREKHDDFEGGAGGGAGGGGQVRKATDPQATTVQEIYANRPLPPIPNHTRRSTPCSPEAPPSQAMVPWQMKPLPPCPPPERQHRHTPIPSVAGHHRRSSFPTGRQAVHKTHQLTGCDVDVQQYDGPLLSPRRRRAKIGFSDRWVAWDYHHFATELAACRAPTSSSSASWSSEVAAAAASDNYYHHPHHHRHNHMYSGPPPSLKQSTASSYSSRSYPGQGSRGDNGTIRGDDDGQATCGYPSRLDGTQRPSLGSAFDSDSSDGGGDDFGRIIGSIQGLVGGVAASTTMRIKRWSRGPLTRLHSSPTPSPLGVVCEGVTSTAGSERSSSESKTARC